jgi:hypothetical protein
VGVRENSNWAEEVEDGLDKELKRLENLAYDDWQEDQASPTQERLNKTAAEFFSMRLARILNRPYRVFPFHEPFEAVMSNSLRGDHSTRAQTFATWEYGSLKQRFDKLVEIVARVVEAMPESDETRSLRNDIHEIHKVTVKEA